MTECVFRDTTTGTSRPVFTPRRGRPTAQVSSHLLSVTEHWEADHTLRLVVCGILDLNTVLAFRDAAFSALGKRPTQLLIDLVDAYQVESAGIATLVTVARVGQMVGIECRFHTTPTLASLFAETGINRLLDQAPVSGEKIAMRFLEHVSTASL